jgi:hypothetical protein
MNKLKETNELAVLSTAHSKNVLFVMLSWLVLLSFNHFIYIIMSVFY